MPETLDRQELTSWIREVAENFGEEYLSLDDLSDDELTDLANELVARLNDSSIEKIVRKD